MATQPLDQQTYLPSPEAEVGQILRFMTGHTTTNETHSEPHYYLAGADEGDRIEIPPAVHRVLLQILQAMHAGKAVTVSPQNELLTTQQAADLLGVSRPTVIKLIENGQLAAITPGISRRMIKLDDALACKKQRRENQLRAIIETSDSHEIDEDPDAVIEELRQIRTNVARARRER